MAGVLLCALPMLHPLVRQSLFGPTIDGIPWYEWEDAVYQEVNRGSPEPWTRKVMKKLGLSCQCSVGRPPSTAEGLPLWMHLSDSPDARVRRIALSSLSSMAHEHAEILPVLRRHLQDDEAECRLIAVYSLWRHNKDEDFKPVVLPLLQHSDGQIRAFAVSVLGEMAENGPGAPELFANLVRMTEDANSQVRCDAVRSMRHFGARGVPILAKALRDQDSSIRRAALAALPNADLSKPLESSPLEKDYEPLVPILISLKTDPDAYVARSAAHSLYILNPKRFAKPATWQDD